MYGFVSADEAQAPRGKCMGRCHFMGANGLVSGWFAPICRRSTKGLELCEVIVALLVIDRSGSSFCGWIPFVVDTGTDVTIIPRKLLPDHAFRGMDLGI